MRISGSVNLRPVRLGFLVPPGDLSTVIRVANLCSCLWGGRYNPIIPFFGNYGELKERSTYENIKSNVTAAYIDFFEPDALVEYSAGMAESLGWNTQEDSLGLPRVLKLHELFNLNSRSRPEFKAGIDIAEVISQLYETEFKYKHRHKNTFIDIAPSQGDAFFDVVGGRYPMDAALEHIRDAYNAVFAPESFRPDSDTALSHLENQLVGPLWVSTHALRENFGRGGGEEKFYVFDPTIADDAISFWNFRLYQQRVIPINVNWFAECAEFINRNINLIFQPIPGNPFGTKFHSSICFAPSIKIEKIEELSRLYLSNLPRESFVIKSSPQIWTPPQFSKANPPTRIEIKSESRSFDENLEGEGSTKLPAITPPFHNFNETYQKEYWVNFIKFDKIYDDRITTVYPSDLWDPAYHALAVTERMRIGREGWILVKSYDIKYSLFRIKSNRTAIIDWLKNKGITATPSEEGQVALQIIRSAGGLLPCGMFTDRETLDILAEMAESRTDVRRDGKRVAKATADRSLSAHRINNHFNQRLQKFGYWNKLEYFLERSVFRAGLRVQCTVCGYKNWFDLDTISYKPTCTQCLNQFEFSQTYKSLKSTEWYYRIIGPFAAPDYARGGYAVALTLRALAEHHSAEMTWSTGLSLKELNCEVDFIAWHRNRLMGDDDLEEPTLVIGEAKSFGRNAFNEEAVNSLKKAAESFPGSVLVFSTLRNAKDLNLGEIGRLRKLALWGREPKDTDDYPHPLIVMTATELSAEHGIGIAWSKTYGTASHETYEMHKLTKLADITQRQYLGLRSRWEHSKENTLDEISTLLQLVSLRVKHLNELKGT